MVNRVARKELVVTLHQRNTVLLRIWMPKKAMHEEITIGSMENWVKTWAG